MNLLTRRFKRYSPSILLVALLAACSAKSPDSPPSSDIGATDAATSDTGATDVGITDSGSSDTGATDTVSADTGATDTASDTATAKADISTADAPPTDATSGPQKTAWGTIDGHCAPTLLKPGSDDPQFIVNTYQFDPATKFDPSPLSPGAKKRYDGPNAGGSSKCSEVMSMQLLVDCAGAKVHKTETEIQYDTKGALTDYMLELSGTKFGVSVTRAYLGPTNFNYDLAKAKSLLEKKLKGVNDSTANVSAADKWSRQLLHVWTLQPTWTPHLQKAWNELDAKLKGNTIVLVTVEKGTEIVVPNKCE